MQLMGATSLNRRTPGHHQLAHVCTARGYVLRPSLPVGVRLKRGVARLRAQAEQTPTYKSSQKAGRPNAVCFLRQLALGRMKYARLSIIAS